MSGSSKDINNLMNNNDDSDNIFKTNELKHKEDSYPPYHRLTVTLYLNNSMSDEQQLSCYLNSMKGRVRAQWMRDALILYFQKVKGIKVS